MKLIIAVLFAAFLSACASKPIYKTELIEVATPVRCTMRLPAAPRRYLTEEVSLKESNQVILAQAAVGELFELEQYISILTVSIKKCIDIID